MTLALMGEPCSFNQSFAASVFSYNLQTGALSSNHCEETELTTDLNIQALQKSYLLQMREPADANAAKTKIAKRNLGFTPSRPVAFAMDSSDFSFYSTITNSGTGEFEIAKIIALDKTTPSGGSFYTPRFDTSLNPLGNKVSIVIKGNTIRFIHSNQTTSNVSNTQIFRTSTLQNTVKIRVAFLDGQLNLNVCSSNTRASCMQYTVNQGFGSVAPDILVGAGFSANSGASAVYCKSARPSATRFNIVRN